MVVEDGVVTVEAGAALAEAIAAAEASGRRVVLVGGGVRYRVERERRGESDELPAETEDPRATEAPVPAPVKPAEDDPWANYDPEKLWAGVLAAAGTISEEEAERRIQEIYRWREEGSRRPDEDPWNRR